MTDPGFNVILVRYGEISVKGSRTRRRMESILVRAIKEAMDYYGVRGVIRVDDGRIFMWKPDNIENAIKALIHVFGVKSVSPAYAIEFKDLEDLVKKAEEFFADRVKGRVFRVRARRVGVHSFTSKDVEKLLGSRLLEAGALKVDLENAEYTAYVEIRGGRAYLFDSVFEGPGGLPLGSEGLVLVLFSGGFDSTVATWRLMKRGCRVNMVHYDLGFPEPVRVAIEVAKYIADNWSFGHRMKLYIVNFKGIAKIVNGLVSPPYRTLVMRRLMLKHAEGLAEKIGAEALATGESISQAASQTIRNIYLISKDIRIPVLRPLSGSDKDEIVKEALRIGTYELNKKQVEVCGLAATPTPRGSLRKFEEEYEKVADVVAPEPIELDLKSIGLNEMLRSIGL